MVDRPTKRKLKREVRKLRESEDPDRLTQWIDFIEGRWVGREREEIDDRVLRWIDQVGADPTDPETVPGYVNHNPDRDRGGEHDDG